jgi:beta-N-acetylhexosaminidase
MKNLFSSIILIILLALSGEPDNNLNLENQIANMTIDEKIGQLIMIAAASSEHQPTELLASQFINSPYNLDQNYLKNAITQWHIGGVIFLFKSTPEKQNKLTQELQDLAQIPLMIGQDCEWGLAMRLDELPHKVVKYPKNMTLGAIQDLNLIYKLGQEIGQQCLNMGIHINFAPVIDVNTNPQNPVIKMRSFADCPQKVSLYAQSLIAGMQESIICCVKHFPGHGDTTTDSHLDLPTVNHDLTHLQEFELYPFRQAIKNNIQGVMVGHLLIPSLDDQVSTFSAKIIAKLLKDELNFNGLVFTDALGMQALTKYYTNAEIAVKALRAGADIILCPVDVKDAIEAIKKAIEDQLLTIQDIEQKVNKILKFKNQFKNKPFDPNFLTRKYAQDLQQELYDQAITVVKNEPSIKFNDQFLQKSCLINLGSSANILPKYWPTIDLLDQDKLGHKIKGFDNCIFILNDLENNPAKQNIISNYLNMEKLAKKQNKKVVLIIFDSPYCLNQFKSFAADVIIMAYEDEPAMHKSAYKLLSGQIISKGKLPISNFNC